MNIRACDVMETNVITVTPGMSLLDVGRVFDQAHIHGAPVVEDGDVIGVISSFDLLRAMREENAASAGEVSRYFWNEMHAEAEVLPPAGLGERLGDLAAEDVMATDVVSVSPTTPVSEIARVMRDYGIHRVLVLDEGRLAGIVSTFDLVRLLEDQADDTSSAEITAELAVPDE